MLLFLPLLVLATASNAATYVEFQEPHISSFWGFGGGGSAVFQGVASEAECQLIADAQISPSTGYLYRPTQLLCRTFQSYPPLCSGYNQFAAIHLQGIVDRCSSSPGYVMAGDSSCIYTGAAPLTDELYAGSCANGAPVPGAVPSAYKKRKRTVEPSAFIGGKVCPVGEQACPLSTGNAFECVNVEDNLSSCGGCIVGHGIDCSDLPGTNEVSCSSGKCVVESCLRGWSLSSQGECVKF
ncbi:hypothetical protein BDY24DRAFT_372445 [Mrakia frigida]|uniref:uncharacterized protein n=1 Tax=Mrakia frigida TaxID=29902 RepID=UPI003FCC0E94